MMIKSLQITDKPEWVGADVLKDILNAIKKNPIWWLQDDAGHRFKYVNIFLDSRTMQALITDSETRTAGIIGVIHDD